MQTDWHKLHGDFFRDVRVLVTGGAGFIGSHLTEALSVLGANVAIIDDLSGSDGGNIAHLKNVERIRGSILDDEAVERAVREARFVFHLAAMVSVPASVANPDIYHQVNT